MKSFLSHERRIILLSKCTQVADWNQPTKG